MHFRVRGNSVQLVKTQEVAGKMTSTPAGSASLIDGTLNDKANELLTDQEKREVTTWLESRQSLIKKDLEVKLGMLPEHIASIAKAVKQGVIKMSDAELAVVQASMRNLRGAIGAKK